MKRSHTGVRALPASEQERLRAHIPNCPACGQTLAGFERIAGALRGQPIAVTGDAVWRTLRPAILADRHAGGSYRRPHVLAAAGVIAALVLVAAMLVVLRQKSATSPISIHHPTPTVTATATPANPQHPWTPVPQISYATDLAFSPSDTLTGYVCGSRDGQTLSVGVTHDSGATWSSPQATGITGATCAIYVNPTQSTDLFMTSYSCVNCEAPNAVGSYRSLNGGTTWTHLVIPANEDIYAHAWLGGRLFVAVRPSGDILVSIAGGPLTPLDMQSLDAATANATTLPTLIDQVLASPTTLFAVVSQGSTVVKIVQSSDNGAKWSLIGTIPFSSVTPDPEGKTFLIPRPDPVQGVLESTNPLGFYRTDETFHLTANDVLPLSPPVTDGGYTLGFRPYSVEEQKLIAPDGTIYVIDGGQELGHPELTTTHIYKLVPGASHWTLVSHPSAPHGILLAAVSYQPDGTPKALWGLSGTQAADGSSTTFVVTSAP